MTLEQTYSTVESWINSCKTLDQLLLLMDVIKTVISREKFPDKQMADILATQSMLYKVLEEKNREFLVVS